jgi:hypothetical protein
MAMDGAGASGIWAVRSVALLALMLAGCQHSHLTLRSNRNHVEFSQTFTHAYAGRGDTGEELFVLVADDAPAAANDRPGEPLRPSPSATPLRQVVCVKILWRTLKGIDRSAPTANAAIDWYVLNNSADGQNDLIHYQGAGLVDVTSTGGGTTVSIRNATLTPQGAHGELMDPVGTARLLGRFHARNDPEKVRELVDATRARTTAALQAETASASTR